LATRFTRYSNAREALVGPETQHVDAIITDYDMDMPEMNGLKFSMPVRARGFAGAIILSTASDVSTRCHPLCVSNRAGEGLDRHCCLMEKCHYVSAWKD
jgi:CheY-like chemotaxis protein